MARLVLALVVISSVAYADPPAGSIHGTVIFEGDPPTQPTLKRDGEPKCSQARVDEAVVVTHGKLRDVVVRIKNGTMGKHDAPKQPVLLDQKDCMYAPRVVGIVAGQPLAVRNSDGVFHNVWGVLAGKELWNKPQSPAAPDLAFDPSKAQPGDVVELKCGVHPWMHAYVAVQDHPFFAVTDQDGKFAIDGLAPGKYELEAWHPVLGTKTISVEIGKGKRGQVTARFSYKPE
jgi:plastocyanin